MAGFRGIEVPVSVIDAARDGSGQALETIYRALARPVYTLAVRLVGNPAKADDVMQETFLEVMRSIGNFRGEAKLATWVRRIAVSKALMLLRCHWERRADALGEDSDDALAAPAPFDVGRDLEAALARLSDKSRVVVWLHDVEGYTHGEIAELTGTSPSYSKSRLARARAELRSMLADDVVTPAQTVVSPSC